MFTEHLTAADRLLCAAQRPTTVRQTWLPTPISFPPTPDICDERWEGTSCDAHIRIALRAVGAAIARLDTHPDRALARAISELCDGVPDEKTRRRILLRWWHGLGHSGRYFDGSSHDKD